MALKFEFRITDDSGEVLGSDWTYFGMDDFRDTGVETIEIHVYSELRAIKRDLDRRKWNAELDKAYPETEEV